MKPEDFQHLSDPEIHDLHEKAGKDLDDHLYAFALAQLYLGEIEQTSTEQKKPAVRDDVLTQAHLDNQAFSPFIPKDLKSRLVWTQPTPDQKPTIIPLSTEHLITIGRELETLEEALVAQEEYFNAFGKVIAEREKTEVRRLLEEGYLPESFKQFFPIPGKEGEGIETETTKHSITIDGATFRGKRAQILEAIASSSEQNPVNAAKIAELVHGSRSQNNINRVYREIINISKKFESRNISIETVWPDPHDRNKPTGYYFKGELPEQPVIVQPVQVQETPGAEQPTGLPAKDQGEKNLSLKRVQSPYRDVYFNTPAGLGQIFIKDSSYTFLRILKEDVEIRTARDARKALREAGVTEQLESIIDNVNRKFEQAGLATEIIIFGEEHNIYLSGENILLERPEELNPDEEPVPEAIHRLARFATGMSRIFEDLSIIDQKYASEFSDAVNPLRPYKSDRLMSSNDIAALLEDIETWQEFVEQLPQIMRLKIDTLFDRLSALHTCHANLTRDIDPEIARQIALFEQENAPSEDLPR